MATDANVDSLGYQSSEELQRHKYNNPGVFATDKDKEAPKESTALDKAKKIIDKYITKHSSTVFIRIMAKENKRTADQQLNLSADLVEILEKIKSELR
jgi:hypothetical protein